MWNFVSSGDITIQNIALLLMLLVTFGMPWTTAFFFEFKVSVVLVRASTWFVGKDCGSFIYMRSDQYLNHYMKWSHELHELDVIYAKKMVKCCGRVSEVGGATL